MNRKTCFHGHFEANTGDCQRQLQPFRCLPEMVPREGIGPPTPAFSGPRSTTELPRHYRFIIFWDYSIFPTPGKEKVRARRQPPSVFIYCSDKRAPSAITLLKISLAISILGSPSFLTVMRSRLIFLVRRIMRISIIVESTSNCK